MDMRTPLDKSVWDENWNFEIKLFLKRTAQLAGLLLIASQIVPDLSKEELIQCFFAGTGAFFFLILGFATTRRRIAHPFHEQERKYYGWKLERQKNETPIEKKARLNAEEWADSHKIRRYGNRLY